MYVTYYRDTHPSIGAVYVNYYRDTHPSIGAVYVTYYRDTHPSIGAVYVTYYRDTHPSIGAVVALGAEDVEAARLVRVDGVDVVSVGVVLGSVQAYLFTRRVDSCRQQTLSQWLRPEWAR